MRSMREPPPPGDTIRFPPGTPPRVLLTVDTEEEFDWNGPFTRDAHGLDHLAALPRFQSFCEAVGASPVYLVDWPIVQSPVAREIIGAAVARGTAEVGIQLHPWVNPPFEEAVGPATSFAGNLPFALEREKFMRLRDGIAQGFGVDPIIYRAGRYGLGPRTAEILAEGGVRLDTSVRSLFDYSAGHGPDYRDHPLEPYWIDRERRLAELPVTTVFSGMLRRQGRALHPALQRLPRASGLAARLGLLERIALTPEGVDIGEAIRGIDIALDDGLPLLVLSFHSPSLAPGYTPYVETEHDVEQLYRWLEAVYAHCARRGVAPVTARQIADSLPG